MSPLPRLLPQFPPFRLFPLFRRAPLFRVFPPLPLFPLIRLLPLFRLFPPSRLLPLFPLIRLLPPFRLSRLFRRERPPAEVLRLLDPDERPAGWADLAGGGVALATPIGLWLPAAGGYERTPWHLIDKASWNPPRVMLIVASHGETLDGAAVLVEQPPRTLSLTTARDLPRQVRDRVTRSVRHSSHHALVPGGGVWVVARRVAGRDGLLWQLRFDPGTDRDDPLLREQVAQVLAATRQALIPAV